MATTLKSQYGPDVVRCIAAMMSHAWSEFPSRKFMTHALADYESLELMDRGRQISHALEAALPADYPRALEVILRAVDAPVPRPKKTSLSSFLYLPFTEFVGRVGLDHLEESLSAMHLLTQRFTAEFCIRPFLIRHQEQTLRRLRVFASDPSADVRRLVSEGTRPRLPWAPRLPAFQHDPGPTLKLLELLRDDESEYVRRSVANHLNDIGKDHPERLVQVAERWAIGATPNRIALLRHALRSLLKSGHSRALAVVGHAPDASIDVRNPVVTPKRVAWAARVQLGYDVVNTGVTDVSVIAECRVGFVRADGSVSTKAFRMGRFDLAPGATRSVSKSLSLADLSTRRHYPGAHPVEAQVNGQRFVMGEFRLLAPD